jgi:phosphosulfolactate synthase
MHGSNGGPEDFLDVPARSTKPRKEGLTHVIDKGLDLRQIEGLFETAGDYVDIVKLGWGTSFVTQNLDDKLALYRSLGVPIVCGGTLFEAVVGRDRLDEYRAWLAQKGFTHVEVSDGSIDLPHGRKLEFIADLAKDFIVMSEVGSKNADVVYAPYQWVGWMKDELAAGAWKVITEAREGGTAGIFRPTGEMRTGLIDEIVHGIHAGDIIFEAPKEAAQAWFVRRFGPEVNLGNIPPEEVIPLETLRRGLRSDTLKEILLSERPALADRI